MVSEGRFFCCFDMTVKEARKIIGKDAENLSDQEVVRDIEVAEFLKNLFFTKLLNKKNKIAGNVIPNMP